MKVAVVGCLHGKLEFLYQQLQNWEQQTNQKVDFILCSGDFQSLRDESDLDALECPQKYKQLGQFHKYYQNKLRAPILTIFVGGNHEASNYLRDLYYGGWVAENIYFLGYSGVVQVKKGNHSLKIGGISGIEKMYDYNKGYYEKWPYIDDQNALRSMYHIRQFELGSKSVDIFLSHEWPTIITQKAQKIELQRLLKIKPYFKKDVLISSIISNIIQVNQGELGAKSLTQLVEKVQPNYWFSAHLHVAFNTVIETEEKQKVEFLALDKPIPNRKYLDIFQISNEYNKLKSIFKFDNQDSNQDKEEEQKVQEEDQVQLYHDAEWISILQATQQMIPLTIQKQYFDHINQGNDELIQEIKQNRANIDVNDLKITYNEELVKQKYELINPQTKQLIEKYNLDNRLFTDDEYLYVKKKKAQNNTVEEEAKGDESNNKRTFSEAFKEQLVQDCNEIDLDL